MTRSLRSSKCLKSTVELTFATQKANGSSRWNVCSVFDWKYLFWVNLLQKLKIISLSWNFVPRLIRVCRILQWFLLLLFSTGNTLLGKFGPKNQIVSLSWNLALDEFECTELCKKYVVYTSSDLDQKRSFWANLVKKIKIVSLIGNLVPRLIWICGIQ